MATFLLLSFSGLRSTRSTAGRWFTNSTGYPTLRSDLVLRAEQQRAGARPLRRRPIVGCRVSGSTLLRVGPPGRPGDRAAGEVLRRPPGVAECLRRRSGASADVAGHHNGDVLRQLVEPLAELSEGDVDADRVGPGRDLVRLAHVEEEHALAAGDAGLDLVGLHLGIGHGPTLGRGAGGAPGRPVTAGTLARWHCLGSSSTMTRSFWPSYDRTGSSCSARSSPPSGCGSPSSCCWSCGRHRAGRTIRSSFSPSSPPSGCSVVSSAGGPMWSRSPRPGSSCARASSGGTPSSCACSASPRSTSVSG